jgi:hypothetical protein
MPKSVVEIHKLAREMTPAALQTLNAIMLNPKAAHRDRILAAAQILDRGLGRAAMAVFHTGSSVLTFSPDDAAPTALTRLAASNTGAGYEADLRRELRRIEQERADQETELAKARAAKANGEAIPDPLALLLAVRDEKE